MTMKERKMNLKFEFKKSKFIKTLLNNHFFCAGISHKNRVD